MSSPNRSHAFLGAQLLVVFFFFFPFQTWSPASRTALPTTVAPGNECRLASCIDLNPEGRPILPSCSALGRAGAAVQGGREHGKGGRV